MKTVFATMQDILAQKVKCPLDVSVIPNYMGINLSSVEGLSWTRQTDGQLVALTVHFEPGPTVVKPKITPRLDRIDFPVDEIDFTQRAKNAMRREGIRTVAGLLKHTRAEIARIPNMGPNTVQNVVETLAALGLSLEVDAVVASTAPRVTPEMLISDMTLTIRSQNVLRSSNIWRLKDLLKLTDAQLAMIPQIEKKQCSEIRDTLTSMGLSLKI
jgi:DNA-directed RNA polymerase alpha subunit